MEGGQRELHLHFAEGSLPNALLPRVLVHSGRKRRLEKPNRWSETRLIGKRYRFLGAVPTFRKRVRV